ncbi:hypothetical protein [Limnohabitans sp.]|uniref:hypothetical protein n=1 Tax=Limnohabitans sp. TaxID=1907725 RepID=UPI0033405DEF
MLEIGWKPSKVHAKTVMCCRLVFFRQLPGSWVASLNVLFDVLTFEDIALDILHVVDLGVAQYCAAWAFTLLLLADVYGTGQTTQ